MDQRVCAVPGVDTLFVQPAANDAGTAPGATLEAHWEVTGESPAMTMTHAAWGPDYSNEAIRDALARHHLPHRREADVARFTAERLAEGRVVCWSQGRAEFGPRALGSRSIVADPRSAAMKDRVNTLKGRQWWRPFGPLRSGPRGNRLG